jgi:hypothetical protein
MKRTQLSPVRKCALFRTHATTTLGRLWVPAVTARRSRSTGVAYPTTVSGWKTRYTSTLVLHRRTTFPTDSAGGERSGPLNDERRRRVAGFHPQSLAVGRTAEWCTARGMLSEELVQKRALGRAYAHGVDRVLERG